MVKAPGLEKELRELRRLVRTIIVMAPGVSGCAREGAPLDPERLLERLGEFWRFCEVDLSLNYRTVRGHYMNVRAFLRWCIREGRSVDRRAIRDFLSMYKAVSTRGNYVKSLRRFFRDFLDREDLVRGIRIPRPPTPIQPTLNLPSREELRRFFEALPGPRYKAMFLIYLSSGLRAKELTEIRFKDVDFERRLINAVKAHRGRTKRSWITFYSEEAQKWLKKYIKMLPPEEKTPESRIFPITTHSVNKAFRKAVKKTGIKITPQTLREWFCETLAQAGIPERYIDAFCGRTPISVIRLHYSDYRPEKLEQVYRRVENALSILKPP